MLVKQWNSDSGTVWWNSGRVMVEQCWWNSETVIVEQCGGTLEQLWWTSVVEQCGGTVEQ